MTDTPTSEKAQAAASTAADEGKHVAGVAQDEARKVASEATSQVRSVLDDARTQVGGQLGDQTRQQRDNLVATLATFGDDLATMADAPDGGLAADVAREVAEHAQKLTGYLDGREPGQLLDDARDFARRRPGTFLLGALLAGVVVGRVARGVKDAGSDAPATTSPDQLAAPGGQPVGQSLGLPAGTPAAAAAPPTPVAVPTHDVTAPATAPGSGLGTDAAGYGRGQELPGGPA
ncbi:hypothetical protein FE634_16425 [Nocardioides dongxiaopingii]|uniref:hypothetical protein n=1 Tax=Nocardioides sp. S-1144 TaxID=2582905 RepID=UPI00110E5861|nr:hypothetical protein [Nocardioides sp. S-1144]QCW51604.1 hypothetical protein FE634_16425 [Nocardioides sp. S-1144]